MEVTVRVHGGLRAAQGRDVELELREGATAGDLIAGLGDRFGAPFAGAVLSPDPRLPREIRLFVGGELLVSRDQPLVPRAEADGVTVVLLTPVSGG
jgi:molybdopterin converting factor small subunit